MRPHNLLMPSLLLDPQHISPLKTIRPDFPQKPINKSIALGIYALPELITRRPREFIEEL